MSEVLLLSVFRVLHSYFRIMPTFVYVASDVGPGLHLVPGGPRVCRGQENPMGTMPTVLCHVLYCVGQLFFGILWIICFVVCR